MDLLAVTAPAANAAPQQGSNIAGQPLESGMIGGEFAALLALGLNPAQPSGAQKTVESDLAANENTAESLLLAPPIEAFAVLPQIPPQAPVAVSPAVASDAPVTTSDALVTTSHAPAITSDVLATTSHAPAVASDVLATTSHAPAVASDVLATTSHAPAVPSDVPATTSHAPAAAAPVQSGDQRSVLPVGERLITGDNGTAQDARIADRAANIAARSETASPVTHAEALPAPIGQHESAPADLQRLDPPEMAPRPEPFTHPFHSALPIEQRAPVPQTSALLEVAAPVSEPGFADALSRQVVWMVDKDAQVAELRINPPELGPVEVRLTLSGDEAQAQFVSAHAEVREAIENALTRLRETLAQAGIQLGETSVSAESFADQAQRESTAARRQYGDDRQAHSSAAQSTDARTSARHGLVDVFA